MQKDKDAKNCYIGICTVKLADSMISATKLTQPAFLSTSVHARSTMKPNTDANKKTLTSIGLM